jgi:hypothetical protein
MHTCSLLVGANHKDDPGQDPVLTLAFFEAYVAVSIDPHRIFFGRQEPIPSRQWAPTVVLVPRCEPFPDIPGSRVAAQSVIF